MYDLIAIGSVVKDIIVLTDRGKIFKTPKDRLAPLWLGFELGEKIKVEEVYQCLGGVAADVAIGLSRMGIKAIPVSTIGDDLIGSWIMSGLEKEKIDTIGITPEKKRQTAFNILLVDKKSRDRVIFSQKSSGDLNLKNLNNFKAKYIYLSSLKDNLKKQSRIILGYAKKSGSKLIISPSTSQIRDDFQDLKKLLKVAKILILNKNEALEIAYKNKLKVKNIKSLLSILHNLGPDIVSITEGANGAWASDGEKSFHLPARKVNAVDVTGAGDAFASGFLGMYMRGQTIEKCLRMGILNGASVVKYIGTTKGLLSR